MHRFELHHVKKKGEKKKKESTKRTTCDLSSIGRHRSVNRQEEAAKNRIKKHVGQKHEWRRAELVYGIVPGMGVMGDRLCF